MIDLDTRHRWAMYVEELQHAMGLADWSVRIAPEAPDDDCEAEVQATHGCRTAALRLSEDLHEQTPGHVRRVIVHELLHLHHAHADNLAEAALWTQAPPAHTAWQLAMEYAIDAVAVAWAQRLPYPPSTLAQPNPELVRT